MSEHVFDGDNQVADSDRTSEQFSTDIGLVFTSHSCKALRALVIQLV